MTSRFATICVRARRHTWTRFLYLRDAWRGYYEIDKILTTERVDIPGTRHERILWVFKNWFHTET
jgi:hypothetical protein